MSNTGGGETSAKGRDDVPIALYAPTGSEPTDGEVNVDEILTQFDIQPQVDETENAQEEIAPENEMELSKTNRQSDPEESTQDEDDEVSS